MTFRINILTVLSLVCGFVLLAPQDADAQAWKDLVGWNDLAAEQGGSLTHDGSGVDAAVVEGLDVNGNYFLTTTHGQNVGKTIIDGSGLGTGASAHANGVGFRMFGNTLGMASGVSDITVYEAGDFLNRVLQFGTGLDPLADSFDVANHSYIDNGNTSAEVNELLTRFDYVIDRDNTVVAVGANNGSTRLTPQLLAPSYNAITVGRSDGNHSLGQTTEYGLGRFKPDIVAPEGFTSNSTPLVAGAGAILKQAGVGTDAADNQVIKAMLFAGATKSEFADWDRTSTRPIDEVYGFGELNIYNSYKIFEGGQFEASTTDPTTDIGLEGFDFGFFNGTDDMFYDFTVISDGFVSAALNWNVEITDNDASGLFDPTSSLANLDLELYDSSGSFLGSLIDSSVSTEYNLEHIFQTDLAAGDYTFRISGDQATDFGFAWRIQAVPEPSAALILIGSVLVASTRRRRLA